MADPGQTSYSTRHAGVAQSVEQRTRNAKVVGSIPISGTIYAQDEPRLLVIKTHALINTWVIALLLLIGPSSSS